MCTGKAKHLDDGVRNDLNPLVIVHSGYLERVHYGPTLVKQRWNLMKAVNFYKVLIAGVAFREIKHASQVGQHSALNDFKKRNKLHTVAYNKNGKSTLTEEGDVK